MQVELLEDEAEGAAAHLGQEALGELGDVAAGDHHPAGAGAAHAADQAEQGGLPRAARALQHHHLAPLDTQGSAADGPDLVRAAGMVDLADLLGDESGYRGWTSALLPRMTCSGSVMAAFQEGITVLAT